MRCGTCSGSTDRDEVSVVQQCGRRVVLAMTVVAACLAAASCSSDGGEDTDAAAVTSIAAPAAADGTADAPSTGDGSGATVETFTVDGTDIDVVMIVPPGLEKGARVLFALPPGGQDLELTTNIVEQIYEDRALDRGWVVASPAAPDGTLFFSGSEELVPGLLDQLADRFEPAGGKFALMGVSNGGLSSFRIARVAGVDRFSSLSAFPGYASGGEDEAYVEELSAIPVRLYVGGDDTGWLNPMTELEQQLKDLGGDVELTVFPGEGHIIEPLRDGQVLFDDLDSMTPAP